MGLTKLGIHMPILLTSAMLCQLTSSVSRLVSPRLAPNTYPSLLPVKKLDWDTHVVSMVHSVTIVLMVYPLLSDPVLLHDKLFGYTYNAGNVYAVACGYFLWDSLFSLLHVDYFGCGFLMHGVTCFWIFLFSFRPFLMYYGSVFLLYELSTPFLNIHWFLDKLGFTGSLIQLINGLMFLTTFFLVRIGFGFYSSYQFFYSVYEAIDSLPLTLVALYSSANILLNCLNVFWFLGMIKSLRRRFRGARLSTTTTRVEPVTTKKVDRDHEYPIEE